MPVTPYLTQKKTALFHDAMQHYFPHARTTSLFHSKYNPPRTPATVTRLELQSATRCDIFDRAFAPLTRLAKIKLNGEHLALAAFPFCEKSLRAAEALGAYDFIPHRFKNTNCGSHKKGKDCECSHKCCSTGKAAFFLPKALQNYPGSADVMIALVWEDL
jgi:hypothetical protein